MEHAALDIIFIQGIEVDCIVGLYPHERHTPQRLRVDVELELDTEPAAVRERLSATVNYASSAAQIAFLLRSCRFQLLESAAHVLARILLAPPAPGERRAQIMRVRLRLTKPGALSGAGVPALQIERDCARVKLPQEQKAFGSVDIIHETRDAGIYRLNIAPGRGIPLHLHRVMQETELVLSDGLLCQGVAAPAGSVFHWPAEAPHRYDNPTDRWQAILCVDTPRFIESDEILVEGTPAAILPVPAWPGFASS